MQTATLPQLRTHLTAETSQKLPDDAECVSCNTAIAVGKRVVAHPCQHSCHRECIENLLRSKDGIGSMRFCPGCYGGCKGGGPRRTSQARLANVGTDGAIQRELLMGVDDAQPQPALVPPPLARLTQPWSSMRHRPPASNELGALRISVCDGSFDVEARHRQANAGVVAREQITFVCGGHGGTQQHSAIRRAEVRVPAQHANGDALHFCSRSCAIEAFCRRLQPCAGGVWCNWRKGGVDLFFFSFDSQGSARQWIAAQVQDMTPAEISEHTNTQLYAPGRSVREVTELSPIIDNAGCGIANKELTESLMRFPAAHLPGAQDAPRGTFLAHLDRAGGRQVYGVQRQANGNQLGPKLTELFNRLRTMRAADGTDKCVIFSQSRELLELVEDEASTALEQTPARRMLRGAAAQMEYRFGRGGARPCALIDGGTSADYKEAARTAFKQDAGCWALLLTTCGLASRRASTCPKPATASCSSRRRTSPPSCSSCTAVPHLPPRPVEAAARVPTLRRGHDRGEEPRTC